MAMISLYYAPDNASLIVRMLLEELRLPYQAILVDRSTQAQKSAAYLELNPAGLIPVCLINDQPVFETAAIVLSLADAHDQMHISVDDIRRPQFLKWLFFLSNSVHSDLRQRFYADKYVGDEPQALKTFCDITLKRLTGRLDILEAQYANVNSNYLFGSEPTIVDIYLAACLRWLQLYPVDKRGQIKACHYPAIEIMLCKLETRKAVITACGKEGITGTFFSYPAYAEPSEGVAT